MEKKPIQAFLLIIDLIRKCGKSEFRKASLEVKRQRDQGDVSLMRTETV